MRKVIMTVAPVAERVPTGVVDLLAPEEIAGEVIACAAEGAGITHLHVRDRLGRQTEDLAEFARMLNLIRLESGIIIQGSTGGLSDLTPEQRCVSLNDPRVETASLNMGSTNFDEGVYVNTMPEIRYWARRMKERGVKPELEIFEGGMIHAASVLAAEGLLTPPLVFAFCLGFAGALPAQAYNLQFLAATIPAGSIWGLVHHGMPDMSLLAVAVGMGATFVRVGFEDSHALSAGRTAGANRELVAQTARLIRLMGCEVATVQDSRVILGLSGR